VVDEMRVTKNVYWFPERGLLDANTYLIDDELTILIDPGLHKYVKRLVRDMRGDGFEPRDVDIITITHLHIDHYGAVSTFKELSGAKIAIHPVQKQYLPLAGEVSRFFGIQTPEFVEDFHLGERLSLGSVTLEIIRTPGHSPDSICFYSPELKILVSGDVIFDRSVGRTDLPGGNGEELKASINKLSTLDIEYLLPGHMSVVEGKRNVVNNFEFVRKYYFDWL